MNDKQLYATLLGLRAPWQVKAVNVSMKEGTVEVLVELGADAKVACPRCGGEARRYDKRMRSWRHLDTMQFRTVVTSEVPRVECAEHGVVQLEVPWAEPGGRFTALFESLVIDLLKMASFKAVAKKVGLSWDEVDTIAQRAIRRGLERKAPVQTRRIAVDETSFQKHHEYVTVVTNQDTGTVEYVGDDRSSEALAGYFKTIFPEKLEVVSMDMWPAYIEATRTHVPDAEKKIVFDKFHVAKHLGEAVDKVRREEHRELKARGDTRLAKTKYLWLARSKRLSGTQRAAFAFLKHSSLKVAKAWALKEAAMSLWTYVSPTWATKAWDAWLCWAERSRLAPVKKVAAMVKNHLYGIINAITHRATNAIAESINAKIQKLKSTACGFRNRDRLRRAIMFHLGGLDLYPVTTGTHPNV